MKCLPNAASIIPFINHHCANTSKSLRHKFGEEEDEENYQGKEKSTIKLRLQRGENAIKKRNEKCNKFY